MNCDVLLVPVSAENNLHCVHSMQCPMQVHVRVAIPQKLSTEERKIVEELKEIQDSKPVKKKGFSLF